MKREDALKKLTVIFQDVFDDEDLMINNSTTSSDVDGWDSLENVNLMVMIQEEFGFKFKIEELTCLKNVGEMLDIIVERSKE